ncbi:Hypothetical predicted protein [Mytilus galloprovincialis]|uniref:AIG1-type G domain-containing protein n=1 Tax=Mytilus galloprovincialis TaxID=29158 RepID=A0A8B6GEJ8_MYTGA|nr:Hypothetical predicted protein [Mytilus galloprovincialis]
MNDSDYISEYQTENDALYKRIERATSEILRMVLIGKSGSGKSETGNALLGQKKFKADISASSVTQSCECKAGSLFGQKVLITDTPGIFDPTARIDDTQIEIAKFIDLTLPGPHVLLFVLRVGRLTQEDADTLVKFKEQFGGAVEDYLVVVFTHCSELRKRQTSEEEFIQTAKTAIPMFQKLKNRFVFLEHDPDYPPIEQDNQLKKLLDVVQRVQRENGDTCYSNDMYETRLAEIQEQKLREEEERREKKRKKEEDRNRELEKARQEGQKEMREMLEQNTKILSNVSLSKNQLLKRKKLFWRNRDSKY